MLQLAFSSTMVEPMSDRDIEAMVDHCRENNAEAGITGSMVVGGNRFAAIIEGDSEEVTATFGRICRDKRHHAIVLLGRRESSERIFANSPMAFLQIAPLGSAMSLSQMARLLRYDVAHLPICQPLVRYASVLAAA